jgi:predicted  nucleic acid-binding Zn-ribbon protein
MYNKYFNLDFPAAPKKLIKESFHRILLESEASNAVFKSLREIEQLDAELKALEKQLADDRTAFTYRGSELQTAFTDLYKLERKLDALQNTYTRRLYDVASDSFDFEIDQEKQAAVANEEQTLIAELEILKQAYKEVKDDIQAKFNSQYADSLNKSKEKRTSRTAASKTKNEAFKTLIEEEKPEIEKAFELIRSVVDPKIKLTLEIDHAGIKDTRLYIPIVSQRVAIDVDDDDYDWENYCSEYDDGPRLQEDRVLDSLYDDPDKIAEYFGNFEPYYMADNLGLGEEPANGELFYFTNSTWAIDADQGLELFDDSSVNVSITRGRYTGPAEDCYPDSMDVDYSGDVFVQATCWLVKDFNEQ